MAQILLIVNNAITALVLHIRLRRAGHTVTKVDHGDRVATAVQAHLPDLIVLDVCLPAPGAFAVVQQLKADPQTRTIPIVMRTVLTDPQWLRAVRSCGVDAVWTTPTDHAARMRIMAGAAGHVIQTWSTAHGSYLGCRRCCCYRQVAPLSSGA